jgi:hypothetical protein
VSELAYDVPPAAFAQRGALGQTFEPLAPETRIAVYGMHPTRERFELTVPPPPRMAIAIDGKAYEDRARLGSVLVEPSEERVTEPSFVDLPGAPPRVGRIADVEAFVAPYQAPAGATFRPPVEATWRSDGEHTGRLMLPGEERPAIVPKTMQIALPEAELRYAIPETRQLALPEARTSELKPERTVILAELPPKNAPLAEEQTKILAPAPQPAPIPAPSLPQLRRPPARERTEILSEEQLRGEAPVPMKARPARPLSIYEESTSVLSSAELGEDELTVAAQV